MKRKSHLGYALTVILSLSAIAAKAETGMIKDMVHFDQVYIPVLAMTSADKLKESRVTFSRMEPVWNAFRKKYYTRSAHDPDWKKDFDKMNAYISASKKIIMRGKDVKEAHEQLEHVRVVFMNLRKRHGIDYFIDHLTRFHEPMENIVLAVKDKTEATLNDKDLKLIKHTLPEAMKLWQTTSNSRFDAKLFDFSKTKANMLHALIKKEQDSLVKLQQAIEKNNKGQIIKAGLAIKPNFAKIFKSFGSFN